MYLMRIGKLGQERPVARVNDTDYVDLSEEFTDFDGDFFASGIARAATIIEAKVAQGDVQSLGTQRIGAPIARPHQIICVGLNFSDHAAESGAVVPPEPILFSKSPNTLVGPNDDVRIPRNSTKTDWEVELGIVIGRRARYLESELDAENSIAGYVISNDISEREFQLEREGQWMKGKSAETFNPCGPWLVTADEIEDVLSLGMWLDVNDERRQTGSTGTMVFSPNYIVRYLSQFMVLEPGDLINTGTPPGVGLGMTPPTYLRPGDTMSLGIDGLGTQMQHVVRFDNEDGV